MARNPVQFQKGISLTEFLSLYGTVDQCFDALYQWRWPNGFLCPHCGHDRCCQLNSRKLQQCNRCHRQTSITAGTIFDSHQAAPDGVVSGHLPHDPGQERGLGDEAAPPSGGLLQRRVAHQTQADAGDDGARPRAPAQRVDPARRRLSRWRAKRRQARSWRARQDALCRRRPDQRAGTPVAHEAHRRGGLPSHRNRRLGAPSTSAQALGSSPMGWPAFMGVTAAGCVHEPVVVGSKGRAAVERPEFRWVNTILGNIKKRLARHLPCDSSQVCSAISLGVRVPVQSSLRPA